MHLGIPLHDGVSAFYPSSLQESRESATSTVNVAETDGECDTLERHSFSELVALAGELLHIPWRLSTFMTTDSLLLATNILKRGSHEHALRHP